MKINQEISKYDIRNLEAIERTISDIKKQLVFMDDVSVLMNRKLDDVHSDFDSVNFERAKDAITKFFKKLNDMEIEVDELAKSVQNFTEKIRIIWEEN